MESKNIILCCEILKNELNKALRQAGLSIPVIYISSDYHINPAKLRAKLQSTIDSLTGYDRILMGYGCCGQALVGLKATTAALVIPKVDDCIEIILSKTGEKFERRKATYFLSKGWLESTRGIFYEHDQMVKKYGEARAKRLLHAMLHQYKYLMFIDTGVSEEPEEQDLKNLLATSEKFASMAGLELICEKGEIWLLEKLVREIVDEKFLVVSKGQAVQATDFYPSVHN
ncbi:MAG: DUF1638 domain-containing protein [Desulfitobacteriia bacterium]|jgi:hypothetical protein